MKDLASRVSCLNRIIIQGKIYQKFLFKNCYSEKNCLEKTSLNKFNFDKIHLNGTCNKRNCVENIPVYGRKWRNNFHSKNCCFGRIVSRTKAYLCLTSRKDISIKPITKRIVSKHYWPIIYRYIIWKGIKTSKSFLEKYHPKKFQFPAISLVENLSRKIVQLQVSIWKKFSPQPYIARSYISRMFISKDLLLKSLN